MPTQKLEYWFVPGQVPWMAGTIQEPFASLTEPAGPVTAYPLQLVLETLSLRIRGVRVSCDVGKAEANPSIDMTTMVVATRVDLKKGFVANFSQARRQVEWR